MKFKVGNYITNKVKNDAFDLWKIIEVDEECNKYLMRRIIGKTSGHTDSSANPQFISLVGESTDPSYKPEFVRFIGEYIDHLYEEVPQEIVFLAQRVCDE